tara:strand:- start:1983 stop:2621 length:639 start_codon:yes stop_codon:yes gene_type:complete
VISKKRKILIINCGLGNIGSLVNALSFIGFEVSHADNYDSSVNLDFNGFILPGVGSFPSGIKKMKAAGLDKLVIEIIEKGIPGIGICLGMQFLAEISFEGNIKSNGLGLFKGKVDKIISKNNDKVPHIGWTETNVLNNKEPWQIVLNNAFYYVHSYAFKPENIQNKLAVISHGGNEVTTAIYKDKILGVQFHPEKSQQQGLKLLNDFFDFHI